MNDAVNDCVTYKSDDELYADGGNGQTIEIQVTNAKANRGAAPKLH